VLYLVFVELAKTWFFRRAAQRVGAPPTMPHDRRDRRRIHRRSSVFRERAR